MLPPCEKRIMLQSAFQSCSWPPFFLSGKTRANQRICLYKICLWLACEPLPNVHPGISSPLRDFVVNYWVTVSFLPKLGKTSCSSKQVSYW